MKKHNRMSMVARFVVSAAGLLLGSSPVVFPAVTLAAVGAPQAGPQVGIDDVNTSVLNPYPAINVSTLPNGQCPWINTGMNAFDTANPNWTYNWATPAQEAAVEKGISILQYNAWVVSEPTVTAGNGDVYKPDPVNGLGTNNNIHDVGGAVLNLRYTPGLNGAGHQQSALGTGVEWHRKRLKLPPRRANNVRPDAG